MGVDPISFLPYTDNCHSFLLQHAGLKSPYIIVLGTFLCDSNIFDLIYAFSNVANVLHLHGFVQSAGYKHGGIK